MKSIIILWLLWRGAMSMPQTMVQNRDQAIDECARELNVTNVEEFHEGIPLEKYLVNPTDNEMCMLACGLRKLAISNGTTLYKGFLKVVDIVYEMGLNTTNFTRQDVESKINNCYTQETLECEFFKCVEPTKEPFLSIASFIFQYIVGKALAEAFGELVKQLLSPIATVSW